MAAMTSTESLATEQGSSQLIELLSQESGLSGAHGLKVLRSEIITYSLNNREGKEV